MNIIEKFGGATRFNLTLLVLSLCLFNFIALVVLWFNPSVGLELFKITFPPFIVVLTGIVTYFYGKSKEDQQKPIVDNQPTQLG